MREQPNCLVLPQGRGAIGFAHRAEQNADRVLRDLHDVVGLRSGRAEYVARLLRGDIGVVIHAIVRIGLGVSDFTSRRRPMTVVESFGAVGPCRGFG